jgi:hypothetical protein
MVLSLKNDSVKVNRKNLQWTGHYEIFGKGQSAEKYVHSCELLPLLAPCSETTALLLGPLPNPTCTPFPPRLANRCKFCSTDDINIFNSSAVGHNSRLTRKQTEQVSIFWLV